MNAPLARLLVQNEMLKREAFQYLQPRNPKLLWLDKNENLDPKINQVIREILGKIDPLRVAAVYPDSSPLYVRLSQYLDVSIENLILSTGSDGVIRSIFEAFCEPGDTILFPNPTYAMYEVYSLMYGANMIKVDYQSSEDGPTLSASVLIEEIKKVQPKIVCLPNPGSPTGTVYIPEDLKAIIKAATMVGALMVIDEAYHPFYIETAIPLLDEFSNLLVIRTFSKAWGMAGLRVGYGVGSPHLISLLNKVRPNYETNTIGVAVAEHILDYEEDMLASVRRLNDGNNLFFTEMQFLGFKTLPTHANFLHVNFGGSAKKIHEALSEIVLYRQGFEHPSLKGYSRFSSTTPELFYQVIQGIKQVMHV
jgi:histidinol-phosphate aminotransferase